MKTNCHKFVLAAYENEWIAYNLHFIFWAQFMRLLWFSFLNIKGSLKNDSDKLKRKVNKNKCIIYLN